MGIPRFASWLTKKFPPMARREAPANVHGLYIDMNGIIHPCCHSEEDPAVNKRTEEEKIEQVCLAVGDLVEVAKPTHILFLAMDGVAPRAKMNQQRSRRYMSAVPKYGVMGECAGAGGLGLAPRDHSFTEEEHANAAKAIKEAKKELDMGIYGGGGSDVHTDSTPQKAKDGKFYATKGGTDEIDCGETTGRTAAAVAADCDGDVPPFDSNCISPGTVFMKKCSDRLKSFVADNLAANPTWKNLAVVVSDTNTPGEGEHKIIDFIRTQIGYGSAWCGMGSHVIHGNDADLILLCLGLHIPRIVICRENTRTGTHGGLASPAPAPLAPPTPPPEAAESSSTTASDASDAEEGADAAAAEKKKPAAAPAAGGKGGKKGGKKGGRKARWFAPKPRFEWYDIDVVGGCLVTELYELSKKASAVLKAVPDFQAFNETQKKKIVVGPGGVGQVVADTSGGKKKGGSKDANKDKEREALSPEASLANNHAAFLQRCLVPTDPTTGHVLAHPCTLACNHRLVDDFITLATLMGNDFMPRLPSAFCGDSAMDNIMEVYVRSVLPHGFLSNPITNDIDLEQLHRFFYAYAKMETSMFRQHCIKSGLLTPDEAMSLSQESLGGSEKGLIALPSPIDAKWRSLYYSSTTIGESKEKLTAACTSYIEGIRFVLRYYSTTSRTTSWSWYFPFHHSPFAADLANFLEPFVKGPKPEEALPPPKLELVAPLPFPQLMAILPPTSSALLPKAIARIMRSPTKELGNTFPSSWQVDYSAADTQEHLAAVMLPFADFKLLIAEAEKCQDTFTEDEKVRNVNVAEQCVLVHGGVSDVSAATKIIEDRVRGGIAFKSPFTSTTIHGAASSASSPSVLEFTYVDIPSKYYNKLKTYSACYKATEDHSATGAAANNTSGAMGGNTNTAASSKDEKNAKRYKRRTDQNNRTDVAGYRYWPKSPWLAASEKGWFMSLADFHIAVGAIASFMSFLLTVVSSSSSSSSSSTCICTVLLSATSNAIVTAFIFALGSVFLCVLGVGVSGPRKESGIKRNNIRDSYVDWLCAKCLSLNFSRNEKCFTCGAPCDELSSSWALFSNKNPQAPPHLDPNHAPYVMDVRVRFPTMEEEEAKEARRNSKRQSAAATPAAVRESTPAKKAVASASAIDDLSPNTQSKHVAAAAVVADVLADAVSKASAEVEPQQQQEEEEGKCDML